MNRREALARLTLYLMATACPGLIATSRAHAQNLIPVTITVDTKTPGAAIPSDFAGISVETQILLPDADGHRYFQPDNTKLVTLFKTLNIGSLRIGGNTSDNPKVAIPANADIDSVFGFAKAASTKVIYTTRLKGGDPVASAATVRYITDRYADNLLCFEVGNEPNVYYKTFPEYKAELDKHYAAIIAAVPTAKFCGPATTGAKRDWAKGYAEAYGKNARPTETHAIWLVQHAYPGGAGNRVTDTAAGRDKLLSSALLKSYEGSYRSFAPTAIENGLAYRLEETNSFYNAGAQDVSNTFASALWGLDYLWWWASHGANGLNFHTGDKTAAGANLIPSRYAVFVTSPDGYFVRPLGYAMKAFGLASGGDAKIVPVTVAPTDAANLTAYAAATTDGRLFLTLVNKEHGPSAHPVAVSLNLGDTPYTNADTMALVIPNSDVAATEGMTLGGSDINAGGEWTGKWQTLPRPAPGDRFTATVAPASALVMRFRVEK